MCVFSRPRAIEYIAALFNHSVTNCQIPAIWKSSLIIPIHKPGIDTSQGSSYRPISLLCPAAKVEPRMIAKDRKTTRQAIHTMTVNQAATSLGRNVVLDDRPPAINIFEKELTRKERTTLVQLRSGHCKLLGPYKSRITTVVSHDVCAEIPHYVKHLFNCPAHPTTMTLSDLWNRPMDAIRELSYLEAGVLD